MSRLTFHCRTGPAPPQRASVLVIVLVTLLFAMAALLLFIERASTDLLVHVRDADRIRLRMEAYSALETTLAVLVEFQEILGGLHSPAEGWENPLEWGDYQPREGREVTVTFRDESGRLPIGNMDFQMWVNLFESWDVRESEAELWADSLLGWTQEDYTPSSFDAPRPEDYERAPLGFIPPGRPLHSYDELRSIDVIREVFFDEAGQPTPYFERFREAITLLDYSEPNINSAPASVLAALARYDEYQQEQVADYLAGEGLFRGRGARYFTQANEVTTVLGDQAVPAGFGARILALRIIVEVRQGVSRYVLDVVISPTGGARFSPVEPIPEERSQDGTEADENPPREPPVSAAAQAIAGAAGEDDLPASIEYPFTLLSIQEMDASDQLAELASAFPE